jgi:hypothetical protein
MGVMCGRRLLIVNADDFGFSADTVETTIECFQRGLLSSATLMANMPAFDEAAAFAASHKGFGFGVHICLTDERPVCRPSEIPSLIASSGFFWKTRDFLIRLLTGRIAVKDLSTEIAAQINAVRERGISISHVDGHGHIHKFPRVLAALRLVLQDQGGLGVRRTQNLFYRRPCIAGRSYNIVANAFVSRLGPTTDHFLMVAGSLDAWDEDWWTECIRRLPEGVSEIGIHPGMNEEWRKLETTPILEDGGRCVRLAGIQLIDFRQLIGAHN